MSMLRGRVVFVAGLAASSLATACSVEFASERHAIDSPTSRRGATLCQPFPDRLIDDFITAYNDRDFDELKKIVVAERIEDVVAAAYRDTSRFAGVEEWARAGWSADDRMRLTGYGAVYPTKRGFQMHVVRRSSALENRGIAGVATTLDAISRECRIESLAMSGIVQARETPCAFYTAFRSVPAVADNEPAGCRDGSGDHARTRHVAAWTGERVLVWGGHRGGLFTRFDVAADGGSFDPMVGDWHPISEPLVPPFIPAVGAWTGEELLALGSTTHGFDVVGAAYDPTSRSWRTLPFPYTRWSGFSGVWTGRELIVWAVHTIPGTRAGAAPSTNRRRTRGARRHHLLSRVDGRIPRCGPGRR